MSTFKKLSLALFRGYPNIKFRLLSIGTILPLLTIIPYMTYKRYIFLKCPLRGGFEFFVDFALGARVLRPLDTATDLKANLGKYLSLVGREDILITKNGRDIAVLSAPKESSAWTDELVGIAPALESDFDIKKINAERVAQKYENLD
jgi:prevent-host-death family protein